MGETYQPVCGNSKWSIVKIKPVGIESLPESPKREASPIPEQKVIPPLISTEVSSRPQFKLSGKKEPPKVTIRVPEPSKPEVKQETKTKEGSKVFRISAR